jgi:hypothetical protein
MIRHPTAAEIAAAKTPQGGWTQEQLAQWGVAWPPPQGWKVALLQDHADRMLRNDMRRRFGKVAGDRAFFQIKAARYSAPEPPKLSRAQRKRMRRKTHNESRQRHQAWQMAREMAAHAYRVEIANDGQCYVHDSSRRVAGPFASNAVAWIWIDRHTVARRYGA